MFEGDLESLGRSLVFAPDAAMLMQMAEAMTALE